MREQLYQHPNELDSSVDQPVLEGAKAMFTKIVEYGVQYHLLSGDESAILINELLTSLK